MARSVWEGSKGSVVAGGGGVGAGGGGVGSGGGGGGADRLLQEELCVSGTNSKDNSSVSSRHIHMRKMSQLRCVNFA
jgi:hypothetical protein